VNRSASHVGSSYSPEASCQGKQKYDRVMANKIARKTTKAKLLTYRCPFCGHWHVGKEKGK
jgi:hypothetical protein